MADAPKNARGVRGDQERPTQTIHPWRSVLRTVIAAAIGFIPIGTDLVIQLGWDSTPFFAGFIALGGAITRVMAMPQTEAWLNKYAPWLSASQYHGQHRIEDREQDTDTDD